jgi:phospholipid transport system substrate-binding protein
MWSSTRTSALAVFALASSAVAANDPRTVVVTTTDAVIAILKDPSLSNDRKRERIEDVVYAHVDFDTLSRLVLARNWKRLTPEQQEEFKGEFKKHLSVTYSRNIESYRNEGVKVIGERQEVRGDRTVLTMVVRSDRGEADIAVDYRLRSNDDSWKIIDVIVEGVSLVANFRSQFQDIIAGGSPEKLIQLLREKNARGEAVITPVVPKEARPE